MPQQDRQYELILLGASGYTGKLVAEWISEQLPGDLKWAIAGRNTKKLQCVADELTKLSPHRKQPDIETCELKEDQLKILVRKTKLVISTIGPFLLYGEPVLAACANNGTHYLDSTGEVPWIFNMIEEYDAVAKSNNAIIIPECGLDSVPADILSYILAQEVRKRYNAECERAIITLYDLKSGFSGGTLLTILELTRKFSLTHLAKSLHPYSISPVKPTQPVSNPKGSTLTRLMGLVSIPELGGIQTTYLMASVDTCIAHRSWGIYQDSSTPYGSNYRFNEYMRARNLLSGLLFKLGIAMGGFLLVFPPSRWILTPFLRHFILPAPGEGPSKESMKGDFMTHWGVGVAAGSNGTKKVMVKSHTAHGGYGFTALSLAAAAMVILRGRLQDTEAGRLGGGILTPATLGNVYVEKLNEFGMNISVQN